MGVGSGESLLVIEDLGTVPFDEAMEVQERIHDEVRRGLRPDTLLILEHPHVFTLGRAADESFVRSLIGPDGGEVPLRRVGRGGQVTYHGPGQVVLYPIMNLRRHALGVERYVWLLEQIVIEALAEIGLPAGRKDGFRGVWVGERKIASIGIGVSHGVSKHGVALNVETDLRYFRCIEPCGIAGVEMTSVCRELGGVGLTPRVRELLRRSFLRVMRLRLLRHPAWIRARARHDGKASEVEMRLARLGLRTVCEDARCPNVGECWANGEVSFLLLGEVCTRRCGFCAIAHGVGLPPDPTEPLRVARAVRELGLTHVVLTSVNRDDLSDGGAGHFAETARSIKELCPTTSVEVLVPDFGGEESSLARVLEAPIEVFAHNVETVPRLYKHARPGASYRRSLFVLSTAARSGRVKVVKSGLMLGLGERRPEVTATMEDLKRAGCNALTIGQYLSPTPESLPVERYLLPAEFESLREEGLAMGFCEVAASPLTRSSYRAGEQLRALLSRGPL